MKAQIREITISLHPEDDKYFVCFERDGQDIPYSGMYWVRMNSEIIWNLEMAAKRAGFVIDAMFSHYPLVWYHRAK